MRESQRLVLRAGEIRTRLSELAGISELADEHRGEIDTLRNEYGDVERRQAAALIAEDVPEETRTDETSEDRELRELRGRVQFTEYVGAALEMRAASGAELEYNQTLGIAANNFPLELLAPPMERRATTDTESETNQQSWLDRLFATSAAARVGVSFRSVGAGVASFPMTTAGAAGVQRGRTEAVTAAAWTVSASELKPTRNAVHLVFSREDAARLPGLEDALTRDLRMGLMDAVDLAVFEGDTGASGTDADITGLQTAASVVEKTLTQANKVKGPNTLQAFVELIDGIHAIGPGDLRIVSSVGANTLWMTTFANSAAENQTVAQFLMASGINWTTRGNIDDATTNNKLGAFIGRGRGIDGAGVAAVWDAGELIRDPYTNAAKGEVVLTLNYLWNFGLPRPTNFARLKFVT